MLKNYDISHRAKMAEEAEEARAKDEAVRAGGNRWLLAWLAIVFLEPILINKLMKRKWIWVDTPPSFTHPKSISSSLTY